jgi:hypothetical protein
MEPIREQALLTGLPVTAVSPRACCYAFGVGLNLSEHGICCRVDNFRPPDFIPTGGMG